MSDEPKPPRISAYSVLVALLVVGVVGVVVGAIVIATHSPAWSDSSAGGAPAFVPEVHRFAVGVIADHCVPGLGESPVCCFHFAASNVVHLEGDDARLVHPGEFTGTCGQVSSASYVFLAEETARVHVSLESSRNELLDGGELRNAPFELAAAHPEWTISLRAAPFNATDARLETGSFAHAVHGYARWAMTTGCESIVRLVPYESAGEGVDRPADVIQLAPVARGTCIIRVAYFGARAEANVRVR